VALPNYEARTRPSVTCLASFLAGSALLRKSELWRQGRQTFLKPLKKATNTGCNFRAVLSAFKVIWQFAINGELIDQP
jgi:hypothetical protein